MSKWIKTIYGSYISISHIRAFYVNEERVGNNPYLSWCIIIRVDAHRESEGYTRKNTLYTIESFETEEEATDVLAEMINGLEREGE